MCKRIYNVRYFLLLFLHARTYQTHSVPKILFMECNKWKQMQECTIPEENSRTTSQLIRVCLPYVRVLLFQEYSLRYLRVEKPKYTRTLEH
jgi:hypothetical protein